MKVRACVQNSFGSHQVSLQTNDERHDILIAPKPTGLACQPTSFYTNDLVLRNRSVGAAAWLSHSL